MMVAYDPWAWQPPLAPWLERIGAGLEAWSPERIDIERIDALREAMAHAASAGADWLYHPFCSSLGSGELSAMFSEAQLVAWVAAHMPASGGTVHFARPERIWRLDGTATAVTGPIAVSDLAALVAPGADGAAGPRRPLLLREDRDGATEYQLLQKQLDAILDGLPAVAAWLCGRTRALDLLPQGFFATAPEGALVSCSSPDIPGFIRISRTADILKLLEMVVHETAHLHFFVAEATGPLIEGAGDAVYSSPVRDEPRPLRGILLAIHACAYIAAGYAEAELSGLEWAASAGAERQRVLELFEQSRRIVAAAAAHLTPHGLDFIAQTDAVADFASRPFGAKVSRCL
jgi:HEXXH motif-containing protein